MHCQTDHMYRGNQNITKAKEDSSHIECINSYVCAYLKIIWTWKVLETVNWKGALRRGRRKDRKNSI